MAGFTFEERVTLKVPRSAIDKARRIATEHRQLAEDNYRRALVTASRWEHLAALLEQGHDLEEANRRAFRPRIEQ